MQKWTQEEAIAFECAREVITDLRAIITDQIYTESNKEIPDIERIERLHKESSRLFRERSALHVNEHAAVARVRSKYGAMVREWRNGKKDVELFST